MTIDEESYWNGRLGNGIMGGSPADYERGRSDASNIQGGIHPVLLIMLLFIFLPSIISMFMASLVIAIILKIFIKRKTQNKVVASFGKLLTLIFSVIFLWQIIASALMILLYVLLVNDVEIPGLSIFLTVKNALTVIAVIFIICQFLAALLSGLSLKKKFSSHPSFTGTKGYLFSVFLLICLVLPVVIITNYTIVKIVELYFINSQ